MPVTEVLANSGIQLSSPPDTNLRKVPVLDEIQAGAWSQSFSNLSYSVEYLAYPTSDLEALLNWLEDVDPAHGYTNIDYPFDTLFALKIVGNSMDKVAPPGSIVVFDFGRTRLVDQELYAFRLEDSFTFKRYRRDEKGHWLQPESFDERHASLVPSEQEDFIPVGRAVEIRRPEPS